MGKIGEERREIMEKARAHFRRCDFLAEGYLEARGDERGAAGEALYAAAVAFVEACRPMADWGQLFTDVRHVYLHVSRLYGPDTNLTKVFHLKVELTNREPDGQHAAPAP
jgi:hypothetical protein